MTDQKELFTLSRTQRVTERLKTTPCPVAHFRLGQTREYPPGGGRFKTTGNTKKFDVHFL